MDYNRAERKKELNTHRRSPCVTIIGLIGTLLLHFYKGLLLIRWKGAKETHDNTA